MEGLKAHLSSNLLRGRDWRWGIGVVIFGLGVGGGGHTSILQIFTLSEG